MNASDSSTRQIICGNCGKSLPADSWPTHGASYICRLLTIGGEPIAPHPSSRPSDPIASSSIPRVLTSFFPTIWRGGLRGGKKAGVMVRQGL
jgi:hypothetical protein